MTVRQGGRRGQRRQGTGVVAGREGRWPGRVGPDSSGRSSTPVHVEQAALPHSQPLCGALWPHASGAEGVREVVRGLGGGRACQASEAAWLARWARQTETTTYRRVREGTSRRFALVAPVLRRALGRRASQLPLTGRLPSCTVTVPVVKHLTQKAPKTPPPLFPLFSTTPPPFCPFKSASCRVSSGP